MGQPYCDPNVLNHSYNEGQHSRGVHHWVYHKLQIEHSRDTQIAFLPWLNGGGIVLANGYTGYIFSKLIRHVGPLKRCFEWCAGPAFIGFQLLQMGYCETLALADVNPTAVAAMKR